MSPKNALTAAARNEMPKLTRYDASTRGEATASVNSDQLMAEVLMNAAESGISTIRLR